MKLGEMNNVQTAGDAVEAELSARGSRLASTLRIFMFNVLDVAFLYAAPLAVLAVHLTVIMLTTLSLFLGRPSPKSGTRHAMFFFMMFMTLTMSGGVRVGVPGSGLLPGTRSGVVYCQHLSGDPRKDERKAQPQPESLLSRAYCGRFNVPVKKVSLTTKARYARCRSFKVPNATDSLTSIRSHASVQPLLHIIMPNRDAGSASLPSISAVEIQVWLHHSCEADVLLLQETHGGFAILFENTDFKAVPS